MILTILANVFSLSSLLWINIGLASGIVVGALPGLTGTMCMALLLPITYGLNSINGMMLLLGVYCGGIYGGSIAAILINTPGTPASAATCLDGYPMARKGHAKKALDHALFASVVGGLLSCTVLLFAAPAIASFALRFGPREYFALALFGLTIIASVGEKSVLKGLLMGFLGLLISVVGIDSVDGIARFTFGNVNLTSGFKIIPVLIGLFAITEILTKIRDVNKNTGQSLEFKNEKVSIKDLLQHKWLLIKSSIIGIFVGAVPGTGAAIASFMAYNEAKRTSKTPEEFGKGSDEGLLAAEAANNAVTGGALIPLLTLSIPGDTNTAVLLGALTIQGIVPGPRLFVNQPNWVYTIMVGMVLINLFMYLQGRIFIKGFVNIAKISVPMLVPTLIVLCTIGAYAINYSLFNCFVMLIIGFIGYFLNKAGFPLTPMIIGLVLGNLCESNLRRSLLMSRGNWFTFFQSPLSLAFILLSAFMLFFPLIRRQLIKKKITNG